MADSERLDRPYLRLVPSGDGPDQAAGEGIDGTLLSLAARRAAARPFFLAATLRRYQQITGVDVAALAATLGCAVDALPRLALCRAPDPANAGFAEAVMRVAQHVGARPAALAQVIRRVQATNALQNAPAASVELLAARDREADEAREPAAPEDES